MLERKPPGQTSRPKTNEEKKLMTREKFSRNKGKRSKFKESYDEDYNWEDQKEDQKRRKKLNKQSKRPAETREKW